MHHWKKLGAALLLTVPATSAEARDVQVKSFDTPPQRFQLIEPGREYVRPKPDETIVRTASPMGLDREFEALVPEPAIPSASSLVDILSIPAWMRGSEPIGARPDVPVQPMAYSACGQARYAPHPTLNATQELRRQRYFDEMADAACRAGVPVELLDALVIQESRYNPFARSVKGASGLTQLMPATARSLGVFDRWDARRNLAGGARYLRRQMDTFGNWTLALGAYNAGPGTVRKYGGLPPFRETRGYVRTILSSVSAYQASYKDGFVPKIQQVRRGTLASFTR